MDWGGIQVVRLGDVPDASIVVRYCKKCILFRRELRECSCVRPNTPRFLLLLILDGFAS
jgi:hypothetical protein